MRAVIFICLVMWIVPALAFEIVKNGKSTATIVVPAFTDEQKETDKRWTEMAAKWLVEYVGKSTGAELKIVTEGTPVEGNIIAIGHTRMADAAEDKVVDQGQAHGGMFNRLISDKANSANPSQLGSVYRLTVKDNILFLIGRDQYMVGTDSDQLYATHEERPRRINMTGLGAKGTCNAVVRFLEDYVGCRWYIPTSQGECVPIARNIEVPDALDTRSSPVFSYVNGGLYSEHYWPKSPWQMANNAWPAVKICTYGGHSWNQWVPFWKYGKEHPEYFALINGKRQAPGQFAEGNRHLCTSNPEVKALLLKEIRTRFDEGFDWVQLGQSDGYRRCECPECEKLDNYRLAGVDDPANPCERILLLHKYLIDECARSHPDKKVHLLVYGPTTWPSKKIDSLGDNVITEVCSHYDKTLPLWKPKVWATTVYVYFWGTYHTTGLGPMLSPQVLAEKIRLFRDNSVVGIYFCGGGEDWGLEGPAYYTVGRLMGDPDLNPDDCVKDYCQFIYGKASASMLQFFGALYERVNVDRDFRDPVNRQEIIYPALFPPQVLQKLDYLLGKAEREADSERSRGWLNLTRNSFDYLRQNAEMFMLYHAYQIRKDLPSISALKDSVSRWKAFRQKILDISKDKDYIATWYPGYRLVENYFNCQDDSFAGCGQIMKREPLTLDFDMLTQALMSKGAGP